MPKTVAIVPVERIESRILLICGHRVMLSSHLAALYGVEPRALVQAVKRNRERFPKDFMFQLNAREFASLKSQTVISSWGGARRAAPYAFTEQGVAMLSSVLRSKRSVLVNVQIMRTFVRLRRLLASHAELHRRLNDLERKYDTQFKAVFDAIRELMAIGKKETSTAVMEEIRRQKARLAELWPAVPPPEVCEDTDNSIAFTPSASSPKGVLSYRFWEWHLRVASFSLELILPASLTITPPAGL